MTKPPNRVHVVWKGGERFDTGRPGGPVARIDGTGETGQGPVDAVLSALASCAAIDMVSILEKRRTPVESLEADVVGTRFDGTPRRLTHVQMTFRVRGAGIEQIHADRAAELSITRYCSVRDSLGKDVKIEWTVEIESEA